MPRTFPPGFRWGVATSGHQTEGGNTCSDTWFLENVCPTAFREPSGLACNSYELWREDVDLVAGLGLDAYRFSVEWARVEPAEGEFSAEALAHYRAIVDYCVAAGIAPVVTYNHFTAPHWFAKRGGWLDAQAPGLFGRYCGVVAEHLGDGPAWAVTLNEPNLPRLLSWFDIPAAARDLERATLAAASEAAGGTAVPGRQPGAPGGDGRHRGRNGGRAPGGAGGHQGPAARAAGWPQPGDRGRPGGGRRRVGPGPQARRGLRHVAQPGAGRRLRGSAELRARSVRRPRARASATRAELNQLGSSDIYPLSLAGAVRYAHQATKVPVLVTEHGLGQTDDTLRAAFIGPALAGLLDVVEDGVPVLGYLHWSLLDNFEWIFGYDVRFGLHEVDRATFARTPKPSAAVYAAIVRSNGGSL
jgi:beta-glucosidase